VRLKLREKQTFSGIGWDSDYDRWDKKRPVSKITAKQIDMNIIEFQMDRLSANL
jgi:hypothetical protein